MTRKPVGEKFVAVLIRMHPDLRARLARMAKRERESVGAFVRTAVTDRIAILKNYTAPGRAR